MTTGPAANGRERNGSHESPMPKPDGGELRRDPAREKSREIIRSPAFCQQRGRGRLAELLVGKRKKPDHSHRTPSMPLQRIAGCDCARGQFQQLIQAFQELISIHCS